MASLGILTDLMSCKFLFTQLCFVPLLQCSTPLHYDFIKDAHPYVHVSFTVLLLHTGMCGMFTIHCFDCVRHISLLRHITAARQSLIERQRFTTSSGKTMHTFFFPKFHISGLIVKYKEVIICSKKGLA